jgi:hypothetical protein
MSERRSRSGGNSIGNDLQAIVEVLAEHPLLDRTLQVLVGRGDQAHVDLDGALGADGADFTVLAARAAASPGAAGSFRDLIEEDGAFVRELEEPCSGARRTRERAALVSEELGLEELAGNRAAVDREKRTTRPSRQACSARAASSLPVPLSPVIRTVVSVSATFAINACTFSISGWVPTRNGKPVARSGVVVRGRGASDGGYAPPPPTPRPSPPSARAPTLSMHGQG